MPKPRPATSAARVVPLGTGRPVRKREHRPRPPQMPVAHLQAWDGPRLFCGRPYDGAVKVPANDPAPEGYRLCGLCCRRAHR